ncbi:dual specificity protein phosphatase family protein [Leptospira sp. 85282-16]|uniref:Nucleoside 2-deoxyribosyltransferase n=1 Tax=Leptospira montravelensis TaxID=2484961 RepID=A0ABY2LS64_9LEPT|nr:MULTISPECIES: dual specificity protein phosphatase family protein [Leptospira]MCT8335078.1 dual specificity protein phosphatase family protein [Leptospira sp. 85282-16]TGK78676.1 hypothetical protein EHQ19_16440 [Leptospira montravelensis]TGL02380.1 hypothetical protein EHQ31_09390 [Leptospira montravelensis]
MSKSERIYCAGPMFNPSEINELAAISKHLESLGYSTFLPPRDGLEIAELFKVIPKSRDIVPEEEQGWAKYYLKSAIFAIDVYNVIERCDGVVLNLNGRVPDEGGIIEATLAFAAGKPVVFYKTDYRTKLFGEDNLMVTGLARSVPYVENLKDLEQALDLSFDILRRRGGIGGPLPASTNIWVELGRQVFDYLLQLRGSENYKTGKINQIDIIHQLIGILARSNSLESPAVVETAKPDEVIDGLYISGLQASLNKKELQKNGITHILSLGSFLDDPHKGEFNHKSFRILDNKSESLSTILQECMEFIEEGRKNGKVLVHCLSGVSRSAAIVTAYLAKTNGTSVDDSMQFLKTKRNVININEGFREQLRALV